MKETASERAVKLGEHIVQTGETVRKTAVKFGVSKSTVHKDVIKRNGTMACLKINNMHKSEEFFRRTNRFFAGILNVFQGKPVQLCGKITASWACCDFSNYP